jgi:two-component system CheB/CheR fusion protein
VPKSPQFPNLDRDLPDFPIVGVGASAGGLEAFIALLRNISADPGIAIVLVQHLDPSHASMLPEILGRETALKVVQAEDGSTVEPNAVYVIPPNTSLTIGNRCLKLSPRSSPDGPFMPIDIFFRSLAQDCGRMGVGVILSGGGSDGTLGLQEVKAADGITFAQDERTAKHSSMPRSAEGTGCVDFVLSPEQIAHQLLQLKENGFFSNVDHRDRNQERDEALVLPTIFQALRQRTGVDFAQYKRPTIRRRIARRMALCGVARLEDYAALLQQRQEEQQALYHDFLIRVTSFFRDPSAFEALQSSVFPEMLRHRSHDQPIRLWVAGCSTGEEVYSLAIALLEVLGDMASNTPIKILATDISEAALEKARSGTYIDNIAMDVSPDRLRRFFNQINSHYQISKSVRDLCVFSTHNIIRDTPFANIDLISCRNVLIYLDLPLQKRVLPYFHYALKPGGSLMLGSSETVGSAGDLFEIVDKECRIYKKVGAARGSIEFPVSDRSFGTAIRATHSPAEKSATLDVHKEVDRVLLKRFTPPALVIDEDLAVLEFRGHTAPFLNPVPGPASLDLFKLVRTGLIVPLRGAIERVKHSQGPIRTDFIQFEEDGRYRNVVLEIVPLPLASNTRHFLIFFEEPSPPSTSDTNPTARISEETKGSTERLEKELATTREVMQSMVEENEATNEELRAANEEILSSNEELQSTNEELQTAKEEMQSTNEELATVNEELKHRNAELNQLNDDLLNLFGGLDIPVIMVSRDLRIRRFTPPAEALFNLIPTDVGRRISDLRPNIDIPNFTRMIGEVIDTLKSVEHDVCDYRGCWYSLRIRPYITTENKIDGAAIAFVDISILKQAAQDLAASRDNAETIVETVWEPLVVLDQKLRVQRVNPAFHRAFQSDDDVTGRAFAELHGGAWAKSELTGRLEQVIPNNSRIRDFELDMEFPTLGKRSVLLNAHRIFWEGSGTQMILLAIEDITNRKQDLEHATLLAREQAARAEAEAQNRLKDEFLAMLAHELRNPLAPIRNSFHLLHQRFRGDPVVDQALEISDRQIAHMSRLLDDLLDVARITQGKIELRKELVHLQAVIERAIEVSRFQLDSRNHRLELALPSDPIYLAADPTRLEQVFSNLLHNAAKYTDAGGKIRISAELDNTFVDIRVSDNGMGIVAELLPRVFDLFTQADRAIDRSQGGLGIGLTLVRNLVQMHFGSVEAHSEGLGRGSTFRVRLPIVHRVKPEGVNLATTTKPSVPSLRILVVEDNRDVATMLLLLLSEQGHLVTVAYDGREALEVAAVNPFDVVLLDIGLPEMSGYQVARKMRGELNLKETIIIPVTGYGRPEDRRKSAEAGFDAHFAKPVSLQELSEFMQRKIRRST